MIKYLLVAFSLMLSGCAQTLWEHKPKDAPNDAPKEKHEGGWEDSYNYYVVDPNSDVPDAYFVDLAEAKQYKKDFAANHHYVIVKIDRKYNVYNVQLDK
jgi:hypothetical protein